MSSEEEKYRAILNLTQYFEAISKTPSILYRGVSNKDYDLKPSIGRLIDTNSSLERTEEAMLRQLKLRSVPFLDFHPTNDWEWLILAQHHGMPTRLLDWTGNPLVALFFAVNDNPSLDGAVYTLSSLKAIDYEKAPSPFGITEDYLLFPPHISPRISAQAARLTISKDPLTSLPLGTEGQKIIIKSKGKRGILIFLMIQYNIGPATLFPGIDGVCKQISNETFALQNLTSPYLQIANMLSKFKGTEERQNE